VVSGTGAEKRRDLVGVCETRLGTIIKQLDLNIQTTQVLIHDKLQPLHKIDLVLSKLISPSIVVTDLGSQHILLWVRLMTPICLYPLLDFPIAVVDHTDAFIILAVFV
jgi:hypothetical protein